MAACLTCARSPPAGGKAGAAADAEEALRIVDDVPNSAVEMQVKEKVRFPLGSA